MTQQSNENKIPKHWQVKKLGEVCQIQTGKLDANHAKEKGKYRFYTCAYEHMYCDTNRFSGENLILPGNGANVGEVFYYNGEFDAYQRTYVINNIKTNPKFLYYHLLCYWKKRNQDKQFGSATNYIRIGNFNDYTVSFPPLSEQLAIVSKIEELLSDLENGKKQLLSAQQQLKVYRQSLLKAAFEGKLTSTLSSASLREQKEGELPEGWKQVNMSELIEKPQYGTSKKCDYLSNGVGVLRIPNIANGVVDCTDLKFAEFDSNEIENYRLKEGDILTIRSNGSVDLVGKCALIQKKDEKFLYAGYLIKLRPKINQVLPKYLLNVLSSSNLRNQIENKAKSTSGVNNINSEELKSLIIPLCSIKEQHQIVEILESKLTVCDKIEETISQSLQQAETLKQSILKKAFEGKLLN